MDHHKSAVEQGVIDKGLILITAVSWLFVMFIMIAGISSGVSYIMLMLANDMTLVIKLFLLCDYFSCLSEIKYNCHEIFWDVVIYQI